MPLSHYIKMSLINSLNHRGGAQGVTENDVTLSQERSWRRSINSFDVEGLNELQGSKPERDEGSLHLHCPFQEYLLMHSARKAWPKIRGAYQGLFLNHALGEWRHAVLGGIGKEGMNPIMRATLCPWSPIWLPSLRMHTLPEVDDDGIVGLHGDLAPQPRQTGIYFDFRVLHSAEDIQRVIEEVGDRASMPLLCAAVGRLKQLPGPHPKETLDILAEQTLKKADQMTSRSIANWWHACGRMRYFNDDLFVKLGDLTGRVEFISSCIPMDLSNTLHGMGVLQKAREMDNGVKVGNGPVADWFGQDLALFSNQDAVLEKLVENTLISSHPTRLNEVQMCGTIYGLGLLRFQETHLLDALFKEAISPQRMKRYVDIELVNIIFGMAMMGVRSKETVEPVIREICSSKRITNLREPEISAVVQALRVMDYNDEEALNSITEELARPEKFHSFSEHGLSMLTTNLRILGITKLGHLVEGISSSKNLEVITPQGVAMALYNLSCSHERDPRVVQKMVDKALQPEMIEGYNEQDISNVMYGLSVFRKQKPGLYDGLSEEILKPERLVKFRETHMANIFYGGGKLCLKRALPHCLAECLKPHRLPKFSSAHLYNIVYGLGQIDFKDHESLELLMDTFLQVENLKDLTGQQLSAVVYSLGRMKYPNQLAITKIMEEATLQTRLEEYSSHALSSIMYGLSQMDFRDGRLLGALLKEVILERRLRDFRNQEISIIVYGLGKIGVEDARVIEPVLSEVTNPKRIMEFSSHNLTNVLYGLAQLDRFDKKVWEIIFREVTTPGKLATFKALELSLVIYAVGMKQYTEPYVLTELLKEATLPNRLLDFSVQGLASIVYSLSQLEYMNADVVRSIMSEFIKPDRLEAASQHHIANVVYSMGVLKYRDKETVAKLKNEILAPHRVSKFSRLGLYNLFYGLAMLKYRSQRLLEALWGEAIKLERLIGFSDREWATISYCVAQLRFMDEDAALKVREDTLVTHRLPTGVRRRKGGDLSPKDISNIREEHRQHMIEEPRQYQPPRFDSGEEAEDQKYSGHGGEQEGSQRISGRGAGLGRGDTNKIQDRVRWRASVTQEYFDRLSKDCKPTGFGDEDVGQKLGAIGGQVGRASPGSAAHEEERLEEDVGAQTGRVTGRYDRDVYREREESTMVDRENSRSRSNQGREGSHGWYDDRKPYWRGNPLEWERGKRRPDFLETSPVGVHRREEMESQGGGNRPKRHSAWGEYPTKVDHSIRSRHEVYNQWNKPVDGDASNENEEGRDDMKETVVNWRDENRLKRVPQLPGRADIGVGYADSLLNITRSTKKKMVAKDKSLMEDMADDLIDFVKNLDPKQGE